MQLSLPPDNAKKLQQIQQQKKRLKDRIQRIQKSQNGPQKQQQLTYEQNMISLLQKKKKLQEQKERQYKMKRMQEQYIERRKNMEREKRLEQLQNQKRMIQLETGVKRMVFQATKQKVKGMNSQQLMMRALLRDGTDQRQKKTYTSKGNVRRDFQKFLQTEHRSEYKQKWDIYELNEKRFQVFQKKQQTLMRQILLKQLMQRGKDQQINVLKLNKKQLQDMLEAYGIDINDYTRLVPKQQIIQQIQQISQQAKQRIAQHQKQLQRQREQDQKLQRQKNKLKQFLLQHPADIVQISRWIIYDLINQISLSYEKRLNRYKTQEFKQVREELALRHQQILLESQNYQHAKIITLALLQKIHEQFLQQAAQQVTKLHNFAHKKTQQCFEWMFSKNTNIPQKLQSISQVDIELHFKDDDQSGDRKQSLPKNQLKKENYLKKFQDYQTNIFDVDKLTTHFINQNNLIQVEVSYFKNISVKVHGQRQGPEGVFHILYDRQFYAITNEAVHNAKKIKVKLQKLGINSKLQLLRWQKFHNFWLIHDTQKVSLYSPWGLEVLNNQIGERIGNLCGRIITAEIFPIYTILGQTCSIMLGFQKGQILKYNMNLNRIQNSQTNLSFYMPIIPHIRGQQEPPFPLQKKNTIKVQNRKITQKAQIHQFREFFDHHTSSIVGINFYKHNMFITVDKNLKCAIWYYDFKEGVKCYLPAYTFQFVGLELVYRQAQNPRFKSIYPGNTSESPQQMYQKWMNTQGYTRKLIYNDVKKQLAYFRTSQGKQQKGQIPLWKISYDDNSSKVIKIHQTYYVGYTGKIQAKSTKIWRQYLMILCERQHKIRDDYKTIKVYGWDIDDRKMRSIGIEVDVFKNQVNTQFQILDSMLVGVDVQLLAIVSSGRILLFSLISGQLLKNLNQAQFLQQPKYANYYFTEITTKKSLMGAATKTNTMEISLNDHNNANQQKQLNDLIQEVSRKYINLL